MKKITESRINELLSMSDGARSKLPASERRAFYKIVAQRSSTLLPVKSFVEMMMQGDKYYQKYGSFTNAISELTK